MRLLSVPIIVLALAAASACASSGARGSSGPRYSQNVITAEELATVDVADAYQAVERLRPQFLVPARRPTDMGATRSGAGGTAGIVVFLENTRLGGVSSLSQVPKNEIQEIRFLSASEATQRFGTGTPDGAIVITRKK